MLCGNYFNQIYNLCNKKFFMCFASLMWGMVLVPHPCHNLEWHFSVVLLLVYSYKIEITKGSKGCFLICIPDSASVPKQAILMSYFCHFRSVPDVFLGMSEVDSRRGPGMEGPSERRWLRRHLLSLKTLSLVVLSVQTSTMVLLLRYSRTTSSPQPYIITTAVLLSELLKLALSLCFLHLDSGRYSSARAEVKE